MGPLQLPKPLLQGLALAGQLDAHAVEGGGQSHHLGGATHRNLSRATWSDPESDLPDLDYEQLDIMRMEIPPGWRGYGAKDYIVHPDAATRQGEVDRIYASTQAAGAHARQEALMPFRHLLPQYLRRDNERLVGAE